MRFADTAYFLALLNTRDNWHTAAYRFTKADDSPICTTDWVLVEVGAAMSRGQNRKVFSAFVERLRRSNNCLIISASDEWFSRGLHLFNRYEDKEWSLTDCISFAIMKDAGITEALTSDHHFEQAGFVAFLRT